MKCILWVYASSNLVVDALSIIGFSLGINHTWLGLTLLSWGNSWEDTSANAAMTRKGFGEMAITACMASPIFNTLFGLGLPVWIKLINKKDDEDKFVNFSLYKKGDKNHIQPISIIHLTLIAA